MSIHSNGIVERVNEERVSRFKNGGEECACSALLIAWKFRELSLFADESGDFCQEKYVGEYLICFLCLAR